MFLHGQYDHKGIALELLRQRGATPTGEEVNALKERVGSALNVLKRKRLLPKTTSQDKPRLRPNLREASSQEIEMHTHLIHHVLRGHKFIPRDWRDYLSSDQAFGYGLSGLQRAIELHDPTKKMQFKNYAKVWIANKIAHALLPLRRKKAVSISAAIPGTDDLKLEDRLSTSQFNPTILEPEIVHLLSRRKSLKTSDLLIWTLLRFGHTNEAVGKFFGVRKQAVNRIDKKVNAVLEKHKK